jgi:hypothetical protein
MKIHLTPVPPEPPDPRKREYSIVALTLGGAFLLMLAFGWYAGSVQSGALAGLIILLVGVFVYGLMKGAHAAQRRRAESDAPRRIDIEGPVDNWRE